ncbi:peptide deformylase [Gloeomargarita lithophora Alchichica-D10]|uniref:Peptide deformylase n=1 Tax=Gloeomargarita lithophora Alchichica-D10 TaxID=1188229 RepID=A0A1J0AGR7_9CYAN|nr:peptide deformylase [Gloeomargarita lithophora]APB35111.1 peptide deformylase [Gloeomargarita lithophora Alchichica-D10]
MMQTILQFGHPTLQQPAQPVANLANPTVQKLLGDLVQMCQASQGVGLAAPQIGVSLQMLVVASRPNPRYPDAPQMEPLVMINPELLAQDGEPVWGWEGCLSVPNQRGLVARSPWVRVRFVKGNGEVATQEFQDFVARIVQHEWDHLQGKVFLARQPQRLLTESEYQTQILGT